MTPGICAPSNSAVMACQSGTECSGDCMNMQGMCVPANYMSCVATAANDCGGTAGCDLQPGSCEERDADSCDYLPEAECAAKDGCSVDLGSCNPNMSAMYACSQKSGTDCSGGCTPRPEGAGCMPSNYISCLSTAPSDCASTTGCSVMGAGECRSEEDANGRWRCLGGGSGGSGLGLALSSACTHT